MHLNYRFSHRLNKWRAEPNLRATKIFEIPETPGSFSLEGFYVVYHRSSDNNLILWYLLPHQAHTHSLCRLRIMYDVHKR